MKSRRNGLAVMMFRGIALVILLGCTYGQSESSSSPGPTLDSVSITTYDPPTTEMFDNSTGNTTDAAGGAGSRPVYWEYDASAKLESVGGGLIVVLGILGNSVSFIIMNTKKMKQLPSSLYLRVLTFTDIWVIALGLVGRHWTRAISGKESLLADVWWCRVWYFVVPSLVLYSNYTLMAVTVERAIAIAMPLKARTISNKKYAKIYLVVSFLLIFLYYSYGFYFYEIVHGERESCITIPSKNLVFIVDIRPWFEFLISSLLPGGVILLCNVIIIGTVVRASKLSLTANDKEKEKEKAKQTRSIIAMLLSISFAYILLTMPFRVAFVLNTVLITNYSGGGKRAAQMRFLWAFAIFTMYLNHAINFLLYLISGREFRAELMKMLYKVFGVCGLKPPTPKGRSPSEIATKNFSSAATKTTTVSTTAESKGTPPPVANGTNAEPVSNGNTTEHEANGNALPN